jgi:L,D-transpeptidase ErfK/SrfK
MPAPIQLSQHIVGKPTEHTVVVGDTLASLGSRAGVDAETLATDNGVPRGSKLAVGRVLRIDNRHIVPSVVGASVVINIPQRMLFVSKDGTFVQGFPVALGRPTWPTPVGPFSILTKEIDPTWDVPVSIQHEMQREGRKPLIKVLPGPNNPLGDRWLGLSLTGVGIHGTNSPASIYHHQTHGCVRLHPDDIRVVFDLVDAGAKGEIIYQPVLLALVDGRVYLESHRDVYRRFPKPLDQLGATAKAFQLTDAIDWSLAAVVIKESAGIARDVTAAPWLTN